MDVKGLQLEKVTALLEQAGVRLPCVDAIGSAAYLQFMLDALCDLSSTDALTGVMNRRAFLLILEQELDRVTRGGGYALLLVIDIDHFKQVNDRFGHPAGDLVLREVTQRLRATLRPMDDVARLGGEEFAVLCPSCPPSFALAVAERVREAVCSSPVSIEGLPPLEVTISVGGAFATPWVKGDVSAWIARSDRLLYRAKQNGRNCVRFESVLSADVSAEEKDLLFGWSEGPAPPDTAAQRAAGVSPRNQD